MNKNGDTKKSPEKTSNDGSVTRFSIEDMGKLVGLSDPQISPDGKSIVVRALYTNYDENRFDVELVQVDVTSGAQKVLTRRNARNPLWSPSGKTLSFLCEVEDKPQIFIMPIDGGEAKQVSNAPMGVDTYSWRPDSKAIAYTSKKKTPEAEGSERHNKSFEADVNYLLKETPQPQHIWLQPLDGGEAKQLTSGEWSNVGLLAYAWSPDGEKIVFRRQPGPGSRYWTDMSTHILDAETGSVCRLNDTCNRLSNTEYSPDGKYVSYLYANNGDSRFGADLYIAQTDGDNEKSISSDLDRNILLAQWMPESDSLLVYANDGTVPGLWIQYLDGSRKRLELGTAIPQPAFTVSRSGQIAFLACETTHPVELYYMETPDSPPRRLTDFNAETAALTLGKQEALRWIGADDFMMDGVLTFPPDYKPGEPYPLVLCIHGGPKGASSMGFNSRIQLFASQGWVVFQPNYRGSDNLGNEYTAAIWNDAGLDPDGT